MDTRSRSSIRAIVAATAIILATQGSLFVTGTLSAPQTRGTPTATTGDETNCILDALGTWTGNIKLQGSSSSSGPWSTIASLDNSGARAIVLTTPPPAYVSVLGTFTSGSPLYHLGCGAGGSGGYEPASLGFFNVKDYGAKGDNTTDDTVAIQAAETACVAAGHGIVYFPEAAYKTTASIFLGSGCRIDLGNSIINYTGSTNTTGAFSTQESGTGSAVYNTIAVTNGTINASGSPALWIYNTTHLLIANLVVTESASYTAECIAVQYSSGVTVINDHVSNCPGDSILFEGVTQSTIVANYVSGSNDDAISVQADGGSVRSCYDSVTANTVNGTANGNGVRVEDSCNVSVAANAVNNVNGSASCYTVDTNSSTGPATINNVSFSGNVAAGCLNIGINADNTGGGGWGGVSVVGNAIFDSGTNTSGSAIYGGIVAKAPVLIASNECQNCGNASQGVDSGAIVVYSTAANGTQVTGNQTIGSPLYSFVLWDGSGSVTYTNVRVLNNAFDTTASFPSGSLLGNTVIINNAGYNPIGAVTVTPSSHAWKNQTGVPVDVYVATTGSYTGTTTITPLGGSPITVPNVIVDGHYALDPGATLAWGVGGSVTTDPTFDGVGH